MKCAKILAATTLMAAVATPALAEWRWVDDGSTETRTETRVYEEPRGPAYYQQEEPQYYQQQQPQTYTRETYTVPATPVVTSTEVFQNGRCDVTRTYLSDGTFNDERYCSAPRIVMPHVFIRDRIARHLDRLRGY